VTRRRRRRPCAAGGAEGGGARAAARGGGGRAAALGAALLGAALCACQPEATPPPPAAPCARDEDCLGTWWPGAEECGPVARCAAGACAPPPALTGDEGAAQALPLTLSWAPAVAPAGAPAGVPAGAPAVALWAEWAASDLELRRGLMCREGGAPGWVLALLFPRPSGGEGDARGEWALTSAHSPAPLLALAFDAGGALRGAALLTRGAGRAAPAAAAAARWALPAGSVTALEVTPSVGAPLWATLAGALAPLAPLDPLAPDRFTELRGPALESLPQTLYPAAPRAELRR